MFFVGHNNHLIDSLPKRFIIKRTLPSILRIIGSLSRYINRDTEIYLLKPFRPVFDKLAKQRSVCRRRFLQIKINPITLIIDQDISYVLPNEIGKILITY